MKTLEEIRECKRLAIQQVAVDGGFGVIHIGTWNGTVIWTYDGGWDHVSVRPTRRSVTPGWDDMCMLKSIFFRDDEVVVQYHPASDEYVNNLPNCLHLWKYHGEMPTPPSWMVGVKDGESIGEALSKAYKELDKEKSYGGNT